MTFGGKLAPEEFDESLFGPKWLGLRVIDPVTGTILLNDSIVVREDPF